MKEYTNIDPLLLRGIEGRKLKEKEKKELYDKLNTDESFGECFYGMLASYCETEEYEIQLTTVKIIAITLTVAVSTKLASLGIDINSFINYLLKVWVPTVIGSYIIYKIAKYYIPGIIVGKDLHKFKSEFNYAETTKEGKEINNLFTKLISATINELDSEIYVINKLSYPGYIYDINRLNDLISKYQCLLDLYDFSYSEKAQMKYNKLNEEMMELLEEIGNRGKEIFNTEYTFLYRKYKNDYEKQEEKRLLIK